MTNEFIPLPCPFCGAEGPDCKSREYDYRNCVLSKEGARAMAAAIELWNSRAPGETKTNDLPLFQAAKENE